MPKAKHELNVLAQQGSDFLLNTPEIYVFMICSVLVDQMRGLECAFENGEIIESNWLEKAQVVLAILTKAVAATEQFNIVMPVTSCGGFSTSFWRWFNWWEDYFKGLAHTQIAQIERLARERSPGLETYKPTSHWVNCRPNPGFALRVWFNRWQIAS
jgi:hypothetical protein